MTKKKLNTYTLEFKESAIKLALDSDESIPQIAKNLGVNSNTLTRFPAQSTPRPFLKYCTPGSI
jgi:transposase